MNNLTVFFAVVIIFFSFTCNTLAGLGDWIEEGIVLKNIKFGKNKEGNLCIHTNYGDFIFEENQQKWNEIKNLNLEEIYSMKNVKEEFRQGYSGYAVTTREGKYLIPHIGQSFEKIKTTFCFELVTQNKTFKYSFDIPNLDEFNRIKNKSPDLDLEIKVHYFDGRKIWFSLYHCAASYEGSDIGMISGYFDINNKSFNFIPLKTLGVENYPTVTDIISDGKDIWMATGRTSCYGVAENLGLFRLDSDLKKCKRYSKENGDLLSNAIIEIKKYDKFLWVVTKRGLSRYNSIINQWEHYTISNNATAISTATIKCVPNSKLNVGFLNNNENVEVIGITFGDDITYHQYVVRLKNPVIGWANGFPNDYYRGKGETTSEHVYSEPNDKSIPASSFFLGRMPYKVNEEDKKDGWYRISIDKGVVPRDVLKFELKKTYGK